MDTISLINGDNLSSEIIDKIKQSKIFAFDISSYNILTKLNLENILADNLLDSKEREAIFDHVISKLYWYENIHVSNSPDIHGKRVLGMLDPLYLHQRLLVTLLQFCIIKKIIENENPKKIYVTGDLSEIVSTLTNSEIILLNSKNESTFDTFDLRFTILSKLFSVKISMKRFQKLKKTFENITGSVFNLWLDTKNNKPTILLLEFDPSQYGNLLKNLQSSNYNVVVLNRRKSATHNVNSINHMRNTNSKIINFDKLLTKKEKKEITSIQKQLQEDLKEFWNNNNFDDVFSYNNVSYWNCIKQFLIKQYEVGISDYVQISLESNVLFQKLNIRSILYQYESATAENILLSYREKVPSLLLRHGFSSYHKKTDELQWRYDTFRFIKLNCDKILVWGDADFEYYSSHLDKEKLKIVGSPRHETFFRNSNDVKNNYEKTILLTVPPLTEWSGLLDTNTALRYEKVLKQIIVKMKNIPNTNIIVKLHPGWGWKFNDVLVDIFKEIDPSIPVYSIKSIKELISNSDLMINITPEDNEPSTVMLEGLLLDKPVIEISLDERNKNMEYDTNHPIISLSYKADFEEYITKLLNNSEFIDKHKAVTTRIQKKYITDQRVASKSISDYMKSF